jgi:hypothetical protein
MIGRTSPVHEMSINIMSSQTQKHVLASIDDVVYLTCTRTIMFDPQELGLALHSAQGPRIQGDHLYRTYHAHRAGQGEVGRPTCSNVWSTGNGLHGHTIEQGWVVQANGVEDGAEPRKRLTTGQGLSERCGDIIEELVHGIHAFVQETRLDAGLMEAKQEGAQGSTSTCLPS